MGDKSILVVEDNDLNMKMVRHLLQMGRYRVIEAQDAEIGIRLAREHRPDLILMDINLPGMDGLSATRLIKKDPALKEIAVVAITSYAMLGDEKKAREAGCAEFITKPIDTRKFLDMISRNF